MSDAAQIESGSVFSLWRYPVKPMMGEELNTAEVTERGLTSFHVRSGGFVPCGLAGRPF